MLLQIKKIQMKGGALIVLSGSFLPLTQPGFSLISIAAAVDTYPLEKNPAWNDIAKRFPGAEMFALDSNPLSFDLLEQGNFNGRTNILLSVPQTLRSGRQIKSSVTIPAIVYGKISTTGEIEISYFKLSAPSH